MSHQQFISANEAGPLAFLISTPQTLRILLEQKIRHKRFRSLLLDWACALLALLGVGICGFKILPVFLAVGVLAEAVLLFLLALCIDAGDLLLDFALEDERFFEFATRCHALNIVEVTDF